MGGILWQSVGFGFTFLIPCTLAICGIGLKVRLALGVSFGLLLRTTDIEVG